MMLPNTPSTPTQPIDPATAYLDSLKQQNDTNINNLPSTPGAAMLSSAQKGSSVTSDYGIAITDPNAFDLAKQGAATNSPDWQQAVQQWNNLQPVSDPGYSQLLQAMNNYNKQGGMAPGKVDPSSGAGIIQQWGQDGASSPLASFLNKAVPLTILTMGGDALMTGMTGGAAATGTDAVMGSGTTLAPGATVGGEAGASGITVGDIGAGTAGVGSVAGNGVFDSTQVQTLLDAGFSPQDIAQWAGSSGMTLDSTGASALADASGGVSSSITGGSPVVDNSATNDVLQQATNTVQADASTVPTPDVTTPVTPTPQSGLLNSTNVQSLMDNGMNAPAVAQYAAQNGMTLDQAGAQIMADAQTAASGGFDAMKAWFVAQPPAMQAAIVQGVLGVGSALFAGWNDQQKLALQQLQNSQNWTIAQNTITNARAVPSLNFQYQPGLLNSKAA